jgi:hypothetical protein
MLLSAPKAKGRKSKTSKSAAVVTSDEDEESEVEGLMETTQTTAPPARPRPRPVYRSAAPADDLDPATEIDDEDHNEVVESAAHVTPKSRPKSLATYESTMSPNKTPNIKSQPGVNGSSPKTPRKRERENDDEEQSATDEGGSPAHGTQSSDIQVRRKRIRH